MLYVILYFFITHLFNGHISHQSQNIMLFAMNISYTVRFSDIYFIFFYHFYYFALPVQYCVWQYFNKDIYDDDDDDNDDDASVVLECELLVQYDSIFHFWLVYNTGRPNMSIRLRYVYDQVYTHTSVNLALARLFSLPCLHKSCMLVWEAAEQQWGGGAAIHLVLSETCRLIACHVDRRIRSLWKLMFSRYTYYTYHAIDFHYFKC